MFDSFKKKLSEAISSISEKLGGKKEEEKKKEKIEEAEEKKKEVVKKPAPKAEKIKKSKPQKPEIGETPKVVEEKQGFFGKLKSAFTETKISDSALNDTLWDLELVLLENNVAQEVAQRISADIKANLSGKLVKRGQIESIIRDSMRKTIKAELDYEPVDIEGIIKSAKKQGRPALIVFVGFNGSGKTTNLAKLGHYLKSRKYSCIFAAADSFRVAAIEQLEEHGRRLGIPVIKHKYGADPAAVIFDAVAHAKAKGIDVVLADTAGRVHTDRNLIGELAKIVRVNKPDLKLLVVEAIAGNDVVEQAKIFGEIGLDGVILTKWDVDEKGGAALSVAHTLKKPIVFLGTGQGYEDLEEFEVERVLEGVF